MSAKEACVRGKDASVRSKEACVLVYIYLYIYLRYISKGCVLFMDE